MNSLLVVDDEASVRSIISRWGESHGYTVVEADSADAALAQMRQCPSDVAIFDLNMPGRDGRWLAAELRRDFPRTALVMTTGSDGETAAASLPAGAVACLVKPFSFAELAGIMDRALDWQLEQATARLWQHA